MPQTYNLELTQQRCKDLILNPNGHAFDPRTGRSFTLNATGIAALTLLQANNGTDAVVQELAHDCGQHPVVVEAGVDTFMSQLARYLT